MRDKIFIDSGGKLSGPFSEQRVQGWYQDNEFKKQPVQFCFMSGNDTPNSSSERFSLEELASVNGDCCPFEWFDRSLAQREEEMANVLEDKMENIQKELTLLQSKSENISELANRIDQVEKQLKNLPSLDSTDIPPWIDRSKMGPGSDGDNRPPWLDAPIAAESNNYVSPVTTSEILDFYFHIWDHFRTGKDPDTTVGSSLNDQFHSISAHIKELDEDEVEELFNELVRRTEELPYLFCGLCNEFMFTARQSFLHLADLDHVKAVKGKDESNDFSEVCNLLVRIVNAERLNEMFARATHKIMTQKKKFASMNFSDPHLCPKNKFTTNFNKNAKFCRSLPSIERMEKIFPLLHERHPVGKKIMKELTEHIGNAKTRCVKCRVIFANCEEYYDHLLTSFHTNGNDPFDLITLLVNVQRRNVDRMEPFPIATDQRYVRSMRQAMP